MEKQKNKSEEAFKFGKTCTTWVLLYIKGDFKWGSKVQWLMNLSNLIGQML
jgi:hypothetical protein